METRRLATHVSIGLLAGAMATRVNDHAQRLLYRLTPDGAKQREPRTEPTSLIAARKTAEVIGVPQERDRLLMLKRTIHYGLGAGWGLLYVLLRRGSRLTSLAAGVATGASLSLIVDEAICPAAGFSRPARAYPASSHVRGVLTHLVYGVALAAAAELLYHAAEQRGRRPRPR